MKFLWRSLLVLAVAIAFGFTLYYAVQTLPNGAPSPRPNPNIQTQNESNAPRPERAENDRSGGIGLRFILGLARRILVFSALIFFAVLGKNYLFERKPTRKQTPD